LDGRSKEKLLSRLAASLEASSRRVISANRQDVIAAKANGIGGALLKRLSLNRQKITGMADAVRQVAALSDPVGGIEEMQRRPNGLLIGKMRVPLGVVLVIYESRPNVTIDVASLCLKSGNAAILRGGKESLHTNRQLARLFRLALKQEGLPVDAVQLVETTDYAVLEELLVQEGKIDLVVPRGGPALIKLVVERSRLPVIYHYKGVCHTFVDCGADFAMAERIVVNAKVSYPAVCNSLETLLVDAAIAKSFLPKLVARLKRNGVTIKGCSRTRKLIRCQEVTKEELADEYLELILSVVVVNGIEGAIEHIGQYGSGHTEAIITNNHQRAMEFVRRVDSSSVMVNTSTRFADGGEYGLGAEVGISTQKLHARGPMGLAGLTSLKWVVFGEGQIRE
jgi:glutamate-5-semialdehyde dehydrogenase